MLRFNKLFILSTMALVVPMFSASVQAQSNTSVEGYLHRQLADMDALVAECEASHLATATEFQYQARKLIRYRQYKKAQALAQATIASIENQTTAYLFDLNVVGLRGYEHLLRLGASKEAADLLDEWNQAQQAIYASEADAIAAIETAMFAR